MKDSFLAVIFAIILFLCGVIWGYDWCLDNYEKNEINSNITSCNCCNQNT